MNKTEELVFIISFAENECLKGATVCRQLRSLWTAYCLHHNINVDTAQYDNDLWLVWGKVENKKHNYASNFDEFETYMCGYFC